MKSASATRLFPLRSLPFWRRHQALQFFDVGGDVDRLDLAQVGDATPLRAGGESGGGPGVGFAGVRVPDMGGEELHDAALGGGIGRQQGREPCGAAPLHT